MSFSYVRLALLVFFCVLVPRLGLAEVIAAVDRSSVQVNESFSLTLTADGGELGEPDITGLDTHFDILGRSQNSSISIINGERQASRRWTYVLLPKSPGEFEIPPLSIAGRQSQPIPILVREATVAPPGEADVFFEVAVDREQSWVQAQVVYTIKLYLGVAVRQTSLQDPVVEGGEVLIERLGEDRRYDAQIGDRMYTVNERSFALFPQSSGEFTIAPARFTASLWERGRISSPRVFESEPKTIDVRPVVSPPPGYPNARWLPARRIDLQAQLRPEDGILEPGEPANVRLQLQATGLMSNQLPEISIAEQDGLRVYPDQPDLQTRSLPNSMRSSREQSFAVIAARGGVFELPELSLPWFDVNLGEWQVASVALPALRAAGAVTGVSSPTVPAPVADVGGVTAPPATGTAAAGVSDIESRREIFRLKLAVYGLLALWLATLWVFWRSDRVRKSARRKARKAHDTSAPFRGAQKALKLVQRACDQNDAAAAARELRVWAKYYWPAARVRSLGDIAARVTPEAANAIEGLNRSLYGREQTPWQGKVLRKALTQLHHPGTESRLAQRDVLPALFPGR